MKKILLGLAALAAVVFGGILLAEDSALGIAVGVLCVFLLPVLLLLKLIFHSGPADFDVTLLG